MLARYYSSSLGRFMAVDPGDDTLLEDPQSWNKYVYVRNNPLRFRDPDGRKLDEAAQKRADDAKKDKRTTDEEKARIKKAEESEAEISLTESDEASIIVTSKAEGANPETTTGTTKDVKRKKSDADRSDKKVQSRDGTIDPDVDAAGKVIGAAITIYGGNYSFSPFGAESGRSVGSFKNKVFVEELKHIEDDIVKTESEVGHPE